MNLGIILPLIIYLAFVFGAAIYAYVKRQRGDFLTEYYVGNRSMTGFVLAMTTASTYASASSFIGGPGAAYKYGHLLIGTVCPGLSEAASTRAPSELAGQLQVIGAPRCA